MERLKSILADKVLDLSSGNGEEVKSKIDKIQRFRDFANALKSLMIKYPAIEDELIAMVEHGDFDTKVASSRVDTVIRLSDTEAAQAGKVMPQSLIEPVAIPEEPVVVPPVAVIEESREDEVPAGNETVGEAIETAAPQAESYINPDDIPMEIYEGAEEPLYQPEDIEYEELEPSLAEEAAKGYVPYENMGNDENEQEPQFPEELTDELLEADASVINEDDEFPEPDGEAEAQIIQDYTDIHEIVSEQEDRYIQEQYSEPETVAVQPQPDENAVADDVEEDDEEELISEEERAAKRKMTIRRVLQVSGIILAVVALIFIVKFIMSHWQTVLIILGIVIVLAILIVWLKRKR
jgi:hypothetical protein